MGFVRKIFVFILALMLLVGGTSIYASAEEISPTDGSEFTILWTTDPQWYSFKYQSILVDQNEWVVENYDRMNIGYIIHTGDFVDLPHNREQWNFVTEQYKKWDEASLAYGVLAGNHDVDGTDYTEFKEYFGTHRFENNEWFGDDYDGNRGHYDLMTLGGVDFIFVYLGYGAHSEADYEWMNGVLSEHSDRIAFLMFHEYLNADGTRTEIGEQIFNKVVLKNPNVRMVLCGHNYNSTRLVDFIDDDGDGKEDRTVYQLMANYQNTPNGGNGYMRFLEFDVDSGKILQRTYSPYLNKFNMFENRGDEKDEFGYRDEFTIPFDFNAPKAKSESDPEFGKTVLKSSVNIADISIPVNYVNVYEKDEGYNNAGVYDLNFSFDGRDALEFNRNARYITVEFKDKLGWTVCGIYENGNKLVSIPQNGRAIVIAQDAVDSNGNAIDLGSIKLGDTVSFSQVYGTAALKELTNVRIRFKGLTGAFAIDGVNTEAGTDEWVIFDRGWGESTLKNNIDNKWNDLIVFAPCENGRYKITEIQSESGAAKDALIPENGFVLAINSASALNSARNSIDKVFTVGKEAILYGYEPQKGFVLKGESIISKDPADWSSPSSTLVLEADESGLVMWNTDGLWPDMRYVYDEVMVIDPKVSSVYYDFYMEQSSQASFVVQLANGKYFKLNSYFEGANISSGSGDVKGEGKSLTGTLDLSDIEMDPGCLNKDGTISVKSLQIYVSGDAGKKMTLREMRLISALDAEDEVPEDFLIIEEDTSAEASDIPNETSNEISNEISNETSDESVGGNNEGESEGGALIIVIVAIAIFAVLLGSVLIIKKRKNKE